MNIKETIKKYTLSNLLWLVLGIMFTGNLFFSNGMYDVNFNFFELLLAVISDIMFIGVAFFNKRMGRLFDRLLGE
jgi:hypothetical protein